MDSERISDLLEDGADFMVNGLGPNHSDFMRLAQGLVPSAENLRTTEQTFHFCIDGDRALVVWMVEGELFQHQMPVGAARRLLDSLESTGFKVDELH